MIFEWDHEKSERNRRGRGFSFSYVTGIFDDALIAVGTMAKFGSKRSVPSMAAPSSSSSPIAGQT